MHKSFHILPAGIIASETNLFGELSNAGLSLFLQNNENKMIMGLCVFDFQNPDGGDVTTGNLEEILGNEEILRATFNKVFISYAFNESMLTPALYYNGDQNEEDLNLLFGDLHQGLVLTDHVVRENLYNTYRIRADVHRQVLNKFGQPTCFHQYSLMVMQLLQTPDVLKVIFYQNYIIIALQKEAKLQIIRGFHYVTAADVVYHLLNIREQFNVNGVNLQLCGRIEKDSVLCNDIKKFFLSVTFGDLPDALSYSDEIKELPPHFFSHLFAFALCV